MSMKVFQRVWRISERQKFTKLLKFQFLLLLLCSITCIVFCVELFYVRLKQERIKRLWKMWRIVESCTHRKRRLHLYNIVVHMIMVHVMHSWGRTSSHTCNRDSSYENNWGKWEQETMLKPFVIEPKLSGNSFHFQMPIYTSFFLLSIDLTRCKLSSGSCHEKEVKGKSGSWSMENAECGNSLERKGEQLSETSLVGNACIV